jgi:galactose-1-phosphate uridylyltransferase
VVLAKLPETPPPSDAIGESSLPAPLSTVIVDLSEKEIESIRIPETQLRSSFVPLLSELVRIHVKTTRGYVPATETASSKYLPADNSVYIIRDPIRPYEIQVGRRRMSRPGGDPGTVPPFAGLTADSLRIMYPMMADESMKWIRTIFAELSTDADVLKEIYGKDPDRNIRRMASRNPWAPDGVKTTECPFCDPDFLKERMQQLEKSVVPRHFRGANIICNDYPYGPIFHYIVMPSAPVHSWESVEEHHLLSMNLLMKKFFEEDRARLGGAAGMQIGLNSTIRHLVMSKRTRSSAGASVAHVHKQIWGMLPGSINLGDHLREICRIFHARTPSIDYLGRYLDALRRATFVLWEDPRKLVTLYVPFGQTSVHELQVIVNRPGVGNYLQLTDDEIRALTRAELIVTRLYQRVGIQSFNEVLLSQPFDSREPTVRLVLTFITREIDIAVSELNLLYVVDKLPEQTRDEIAPHLEAVLADLQ